MSKKLSKSKVSKKWLERQGPKGKPMSKTAIQALKEGAAIADKKIKYNDNIYNQSAALSSLHIFRSDNTENSSDEYLKHNANKVNQVIKHLKDTKQISTKEISDGHHTFGDLYKHRIILFCVICNMFPNLAWKSKKHYDEENDFMFNDSFIAGINTPQGIATYHIKLSYWDLFEIPEIERAPKFDNYTSDDVLERLLSLNKIEDKKSLQKRKNIE